MTNGGHPHAKPKKPARGKTKERKAKSPQKTWAERTVLGKRGRG